jgi:hypothetical protein
MAYSTITKPSDYFNNKLYTGNGSARTITGVGFQPDWVWVKDRSSTNFHYVYDVVRGNNLNLYTNDNSAQTNVTTALGGGGIGSQASDGFTIVAGTSNTNNVNTNSNNYVSWNWLAGGSQGSSNTDGSINTTYTSVNTTAGFSISKYTGTGANATVGHGLGVAPSMILFKNLSSARTWIVYHKSVGATKNLYLDLNNAENTASDTFQNTDPTSTVFSIGTSVGVNESGDDIIAYCFAEKKGYSKFGSYTGNGNADGTFIYTGFKPAFVIIKPSSYVNSWGIFDNKRPGYNVTKNRLEADNTSAENTVLDYFDFLSNGFKVRTSNSHPNNSGGTLIYMAFAEEPLVANVGANGIPATAR